MKKTYILKTALLMMIMAIFQAAPVYASQETSLEISQETPQDTVGSLDVFNDTQISGWVCAEGDPLNTPEIQIRITNSLTNETVRELTTVPTGTRAELSSMFGGSGAPTYSVHSGLSSLPDGLYTAAAYADGEKFGNTLSYVKGEIGDVCAQSGVALGSFRLTAYCPCRSCSEGWGRRTSSGALATANHTVAVDPRVIPIGSKLLIDGTVYTAEDVGGAVKGNHIDIYFDTHAQTREFGTRRGEVYLVK